MSDAAAVMLAVGGEVWVADETALREFPPLRASWSLVGHPALVTISGRNARRTLFGTLNIATGGLVCLPLPRCRTDEVVAAIAELGMVRPEVPKLLIWDNAPPHHPNRVRDAAAAAGITLAFLPFRAPELMPLEDPWRGLKQTVAANRGSASLEDLVTAPSPGSPRCLTPSAAVAAASTPLSFSGYLLSVGGCSKGIILFVERDQPNPRHRRLDALRWQDVLAVELKSLTSFSAWTWSFGRSSAARIAAATS